MRQIVSRFTAAHLRQPEVDDLHRHVAGGPRRRVRARRRRRLRPCDLQNDVGRLQIAMHDAAFVRRFQRVGELPRNREGLADWQPSRWLMAEPLFKRLALDELEDQRVNAFAVLEPVDGADVRMIQRREQPGLALESRAPFGIRRERVRQNLDRHLASKLGIPRAVDVPHPARSEQGSNLVGPQPLSGEQSSHPF